MTAGLHVMHSRLLEARTREEALERIGFFRRLADSAMAVARTVRDELKALVAEPLPLVGEGVGDGRERLLDALWLRRGLREVRRRVLEVTYYVHC